MGEEETQELPASITDAQLQVAKLSGILQEAQKNKARLTKEYEDKIRKSKEKENEGWVDH